MLSHENRFKILWDWLILLATLYMAVTVSYNISFKVNDHSFTSICSEIVVEILFFVGE